MNTKNYIGIGCFAFFLLYFYLLIAHFETTFLVTIIIFLLLYILRKQVAVWANKFAMMMMQRKMKKMAEQAMGGDMGSAMNDMMNMFNNMQNQQSGKTGSKSTMLLKDTTAFLAKRSFNLVERKEENTKHPTYIYERARTDYNICISIDVEGRDITYSLSSTPSGKAPFSDVITDTEEDIIAELRSAL